METKFKVIMKKDRKVLEDFILFSQRVNSPMVKTKMAIISIGFVMIGVFARKDSVIAGIVIGVLGILMLLYSLFRYKLAAGRLAKADQS